MPSDIQPLANYSEETIAESFSHLLRELESDAASILSSEQIEAFRLRWDGRKQGRLPDISGIWLKGAPDAVTRKLTGEQFAKLKARFVELNEYLKSPARLVKVPVSEPGLVLEYATQGGTIERDLLKKRYPYPLDI